VEFALLLPEAAVSALPWRGGHDDAPRLKEIYSDHEERTRVRGPRRHERHQLNAEFYAGRAERRGLPGIGGASSE
jgi:hypothetical protein